MRTHEEPKSTFEGGSTRSELNERYDLVPREAIDAIARRLALGAKRHGDRNWERGGEEFRQATINHLFRHLLDYVQNGNTDDQNTDAIICNAAMLCHFEQKLPLKPQREPLRSPEQREAWTRSHLVPQPGELIDIPGTR